MTTQWSYSGDPASSSKDAVRFHTGDTDPKNPVLTDAEINYAIAIEGSIVVAAITCAENGMAKFVRLVSESTTEDKKNFKKEWQQRVDGYKTLIAQLKARRARGSINLYAGAMSASEKANVDQDPDRVAPDFRKTLHEDPSIQTPQDDLRSDF